jgi:aprataxin
MRSFRSSIALGASTATLPLTFTMFDLSILQKYAKKFESSSLPPTLLLTNTETSLTLFDKYPKAIFHFLLLPRIIAGSEFTANDLTNMQTLLVKGKKAGAKVLIQKLKKDAETVKEMVEKEMLKKHGYKWDVWIGFHAVPSMVYVWERWQPRKDPSPFSHKTLP